MVISRSESAILNQANGHKASFNQIASDFLRKVAFKIFLCGSQIVKDPASGEFLILAAH